MKTVIIGGVAGGASAAARLRRLHEHDEIVLIERGPYISFANCGLPYYISGVIAQQGALTLQTPQSFYDRFRVDVRVDQEAIHIDRQHKTVTIRNLKTDGTYEEAYDKLILSPGARPLDLPIAGKDLPGVFYLRTIPDTVAIKAHLERTREKTAVVVGGGYIGLEGAENFAEAGCKVHVIEKMNQILPPFDYEMACEAMYYLEEQGIQLHLNCGLTAIAQKGDHLCVTLEDGSAIDCGVVLLAAGVRPEGDLAKNAGLSCNAKGAIVVNAQMQTSDPDIYAVGDAIEVRNFVTGEPALIPLAGPANRQGRLAADHICGRNVADIGTQGSSVLKLFEMTAAATGINERTARQLGIAYDKTYINTASHAGYYPGGRNLSIKLLCAKEDGRVLGGQVVGFEGVDKRCDVIAVAIRAGMTAHDLTKLELCYAPPFSSAKDPVNVAGMVIQNVRDGLLRQFFFDEVDALPCDGSVTKLDVRTVQEYESGHIDGFLNIPLNELRQRMDKLPKGKPIYVHCHSGLRSYVACRILCQNGFDPLNLAGGYRLYDLVMRQGKDPVQHTHPCGKPQ